MTIAQFVYTVVLKPRPLKALANWMIKRLLPERIEVQAATIYLNPNDPVISGALRFHVYENDEIAFFHRHFSSQMNFIDVGANVGLYTGLALSTPGYSGKILCLEPDDESRKYLQKTIDASRRQGAACEVIISEMAATDADSTTMLYKNPINRGDNRLYPDSRLQAAGEVKTTTLDSLCHAHRLDSIDFLKIDVQGGECDVIAGARNILQASRDCILMSEFWPYGLSKAGSDAETYLKMLAETGFTLFRLGKAASLRPLNAHEIINTTRGSQYTNIVGFKGKYLDLVDY